MVVLAAMLAGGFSFPLHGSLIRFFTYWAAFGFLLICLLLVAVLDVLETLRLREKERLRMFRRMISELRGRQEEHDGS
jgi:hypothetical protein